MAATIKSRSKKSELTPFEKKLEQKLLPLYAEKLMKAESTPTIKYYLSQFAVDVANLIIEELWKALKPTNK